MQTFTRSNPDLTPVPHRKLVWPPRWLQSGSEAQRLAVRRQWQPRVWTRTRTP